MKDSKIVLALLTACALGMTGPVMARGAVGGGLDGHQRAERTAKADRQARKEQRRERKAERRQSRRQDGAGKDAGGDRRSERRERRAERAHLGRRDRAQRRDLYRRDVGYSRGERRRQTVGDGWSKRRGHGKQHRFEQRIDRRLSKQHDRVRHGWKSGEITRKELKRIRKDRRKIARMDRRFGSDGHYTRHERRKLNRAMDRASQRIYRTKHNHRIAGVGRGRAYRR